MSVIEIKVLAAAWEVSYAGQHDCGLILHFWKMHDPPSKCCWIYILTMNLQDLISQMELFSCSSWNKTEKIQISFTDHVWNLERKTQMMPWLTFFAVPQTGVGEEGSAGQPRHKSGRNGATQGRADWAEGCCTGSLFLPHPNGPFCPWTLIWSLREEGGQSCGGSFSVQVGKTSQSGVSHWGKTQG